MAQRSSEKKSSSQRSSQEKSSQKKADSSSSLKDPDLYKDLRDEGNSKEKAARISNAAANRGRSSVGKSGGKSPAYDDWTVKDLRGRAKELGLQNYSNKNKSDLIDLLRSH